MRHHHLMADRALRIVRQRKPMLLLHPCLQTIRLDHANQTGRELPPRTVTTTLETYPLFFCQPKTSFTFASTDTPYASASSRLYVSV